MWDVEDESGWLLSVEGCITSDNVTRGGGGERFSSSDKGDERKGSVRFKKEDHVPGLSGNTGVKVESGLLKSATLIAAEKYLPLSVSSSKRASNKEV